jgi:hypothetical protein
MKRVISGKSQRPSGTRVSAGAVVLTGDALLAQASAQASATSAAQAQTTANTIPALVSVALADASGIIVSATPPADPALNALWLQI